jgi:hypothetical protein
MTRVEIVANHSVEENILDAFRELGVGKYYTKYPTVYGVGSSGPRMGDAVWPEENFALVIWCEEPEAGGIEQAVALVKKEFPNEGIKLFRLSDSPKAPPVTRVVSLALPEPRSATVAPLTALPKGSVGPEGENS